MKKNTRLSSSFAVLSVLLLLTFPAILKADNEIRVELTTKKELAPLYISRFFGEPSPYLKKLRQILHFDLHHSGYFKVPGENEGFEKTLSLQDFKTALNPQKWINTGIAYVIKTEVHQKKLDLFVLNSKTGSVKKFEEIPLTGDLHLDRKQIHRLSDAILKTLLGVEGIANTPILYSFQGCDLENWQAEIWQCDWDGGNQKQVTAEEHYCITPVFMPAPQASDQYLYVNYKNGQPKIYLSSLKTPVGKPFLDLRGNQLLPCVSRQRDKVVFISDAAGRADLFLQKMDGEGNLIQRPQQLFSYPGATQASPTFNPDGSKIAFVSDKDGSPRIYIIPSMLENHKRAEPALISKINRENTCPNWSPDGLKLAYSAKTGGVRQIWIYDFSSGEEVQLTSGPGNKENPCWAPDSLHLVFNSTDPDSTELYLVNLNQPEVIKITSEGGKKHYPTWGTK